MRFEAKVIHCVNRTIPVVRHGDNWFVPVAFLARALELDARVELRRVTQLLTWWKTVFLDVAWGYRRASQPCMPIDRLQSYLVLVASSRRGERRHDLERVVNTWNVAMHEFLMKNDPAHAVRNELANGHSFDMTAMLERVESEAYDRAIRLSRSLAASHASGGRKRLSVEQFQRIKDLAIGGMIQKHIAKEVKCSPSTVCMVLKGKYPFPNDVAGRV